MSFPRYASYRDSGTDWLGDVPSGWSIKRLGFFFDERREKVSDKDYEPLSVTKNGVLPQLDTAAKTDDGDNRKKVCAGDFVINSRSDRKGSAGLARKNGSVSLINAVLIPRGGIDAEFAHYLLTSTVFQEEFYRCGKGIVADLWTTNYSEMRNILLAVPPAADQHSICRFLARELDKIDSLIVEQYRLIDLLRENRRELMTNAVTRGLNPPVATKPSGVDWLGRVPTHWETSRVKLVSCFITSGPRGWSERVGDEGSLFIQSGDLNDLLKVDFAAAKRVRVSDDAEARRTRLIDGDVVVCITGAKTGNVAVCATVPEAAYVNQHLCLIRPTAKILPTYLGALLKSRIGQVHFDLSQYGLKQGLSLEDVANAPVLVPPLDEQAGIADFVAREIAKLDSLGTEAQRGIDLLQERRSALISAIVTGKIDVRAIAANLPERNATA
ncbi:MAG: restriction endonuclease subunit S [Steroidobacteraceae bacterium]